MGSNAGDVPCQDIGMIVAGSSRMPLAPGHDHIRMPLQQDVQLLPEVRVRDGPPPRSRVWIDPFPAVISPDDPPSATPVDDMVGIRPEDGRLSRRAGFDPGHGFHCRQHFKRIVRRADIGTACGMYLSVAFQNNERPSSGVGGGIEGAVGVDVKRSLHY